MKRIRAFAMLFSAACLATAATAGTPPHAAPAERALRAEAGVNRMHPRFAVLDAAGADAIRSGRPASSATTCGACHDARYIDAHSGHWNERVQVSCVACHWQGGRLPSSADAVERDGLLRREVIRVSSPQDAECGACHGIVHTGEAPVSVPPDFEAPPEGGRDYGFTARTGAVFSEQDVASSYLDLEGKEARTYAWDVHARRLVRCVDCHFAANNPMRKDLKRTRLDFLVQDPRRITLAEFLRRPDHRLVAAGCRTCHDPLEAHAFLPYPRRHLDALECESCHIPRPMAPAAQMIDATVVRADGAPVVVYRGMTRGAGMTLDAAFSRGYRPLLLLHRNASGEQRVGPFNAVERWYWASARTDSAAPAATVRAAYLEGGRYAPAVLSAFDANRDGVLDASELRVDSPGRLACVTSRLAALGVAEPVIRRTVTLVPLRHGVQSGAQVQRDCANCHAKDSRLDASLPLSPYMPGGVAAPARIEGAEAGDGVRVVSTSGTSRLEARLPGGSPFYVFGWSRRVWAGRIGFAAFLAVCLGTMLHAGLRLVTRRKREAHAAPRRRVYLYSVYERVWHWLMAASILALVFTGLQVEFASARTVVPLPTAVRVHNFFAVVLVVNAFLSLFYHLAAGAIRQFIPPREGLARRVAEQARYYATGMLLGRPQPSPRTARRKLNPLQQLTYLALLNVLFPLQAVTGTLVWGASRWPQLAGVAGGLTVVAPLHALGAWFFLAFVVLHLYLTTTGHTIFAHVRAMIDGHEELEVPEGASGGGSHA